MKNALNWLKSNPLLIVAAVLVFAALISLVIVQMQAGAFVDEMAARNKKISDIKNLRETRVTLPPEKPDGEPEQVTITVNEAAIEAIEKIYGRMSDEYTRIFREATQFNRQGHIPMLEKLFPRPSEGEMYLLYDARIYYTDAFKVMFRDYSRTSLYPNLNAGGPIPLALLDDAVARAQAEFLGHFRVLSNLTAEEREELRQKKTAAVMKEMSQHASKFSIYAESTPGAPNYPFEIMNWASKEEQPNLAEVWEGQMSLWIQQDIVEAIGKTNNVSNNEANVTVAPIKRLFKIEVGNRYVGLSLQPVTIGGSAAAAAAAGGGGGAAAAGGTGGKTDFALSPTGRVSNDIFDVRHVRVHMLMDWKHMSEFMGALARTNFMTVLDVDVKDIDEYEALRSGYFYGNGDVVDVTMLIETLWLREWTTDLMPDLVKQAMGIPIERPAAETEGIN